VPALRPHCITRITLDERSVVKRSAEIEREREVAISDLLAANHFVPRGARGGPYDLTLSVTENRLVFDVKTGSGRALGRIMLSLTPFRRVVKDYFLLCESYYAALQDAPRRIEAIDMGRRALHDEGSRLLADRLKGKVDLDFDTARRLFTLICVLHLRG
jgi:uncharacterized protein (UPF0262 family)